MLTHDRHSVLTPSQMLRTHPFLIPHAHPSYLSHSVLGPLLGSSMLISQARHKKMVAREWYSVLKSQWYSVLNPCAVP